MNLNFLSAEEILFLSNSFSNLIFFDCSFKRLNSLNSFDEFINCRISNSIFFNILEFSLKDSLCPPMISDIQTFNESLSSLGVSNEDHIILYGVSNSPSISRAVSSISFLFLFKFLF